MAPMVSIPAHDDVSRLHAPRRAARAARAGPPLRPRRDRPARAADRSRRARHPRRGLRAAVRQDEGRRAVGARGAGEVRRRRARHLQHVAWFSRRCRSTAWVSTAPAAASSAATRRRRSGRGSQAQIEKYAVPTLREGWRDVLRHHRALGRLRSGRRHPDARRAARRQVGAERPQGVHLQRATTGNGASCSRAPDKEKGRAGISCFILEPGTPGFTAKPIRTIRTAGHSQRRGLRGLRAAGRRADRRRRGRGSISPSTCS